MTGYGKAEFTLSSGVKNDLGEDILDSFAIEVKSLNHRYLDIKLKAPERFYPIEIWIREEVKKTFSRGSFAIYVKSINKGASSFSLNMPLIRAYLGAEKELKDHFALEGKLDLNSVLHVKDIFIPAIGEAIDAKQDWERFKPALALALDELMIMRRVEGDALKHDILERLEEMEGLLTAIEARVPLVVKAMADGFRVRLSELIGEAVDEVRIASEAAVFADKTNVAEEVVRFRSHLRQVRSYMDSKDSVGRKLDFLCQELLREANTIGSKSPDVDISQSVVELKGELEKIREQVQNVE
jgi:uncharacterized protein (TIGR00255 family)